MNSIKEWCQKQSPLIVTIVYILLCTFAISVVVLSADSEAESTTKEETGIEVYEELEAYEILEEETLGRSGISRYVVSRVSRVEADEEEEEYDFYVMGVANIPLKDTVKIERMRSYDPVKGLVLLDSYVIIPPEGNTKNLQARIGFPI